MKQAEPFLRHIQDEIYYILNASTGLTYDAFISDETIKRSIVRSLEVIGEATKNIPASFRNKNPQIEWKKIAGLRDVLIHHYFGVDYRAVWDIVKNRIPSLAMQIDSILDAVKNREE